MGVSVILANISLDASWGDGAVAAMPASPVLRFYDADPRVDGVELDTTNYPGYAGLAVTNNTANFPDAVAGEKVTAQFTVCTATGTWAAAPAWAALCDGTDVLEAVEVVTDDASIPRNGGAVLATLYLFYDEVTD